MKKSWYYKILIATVALLVLMQRQTVVPNQEIVLEFFKADITSDEAQNAIAIVKKQLESIGVKNTRISKTQLQNGKLTIRYYSETDIESIKKVLSKDNGIVLEHGVIDYQDTQNQFPLNNTSFDYNVDVHEIHKSSDVHSDFNGIYVLEIKQKHERASGIYGYNTSSGSPTDHLSRLVYADQKIHGSIAIVIDNTSYKIPEVRAGPFFS